MFSRFSAWFRDWEHQLEEAWAYDLKSPEGMKRADWHAKWIDHGFLRKYWTNLYEISPGVWRSNQPDRRRVRRYHEMGIKTIINLRGESKRGFYIFERRRCDRFGIRLIDISLQARAAAPREQFLALLDAFETCETPMLMHCKSGADRAGLASAMYLMHMKEVPVTEARKQLGLKFAHIRASRTGILDYMLDVYTQDVSKDPMTLRTWIEKKYDPDALMAAFNTKRGYT